MSTAAAPLLAVEQDTQHGPTRALLDTLRRNGWRVTAQLPGGVGLLFHPDFGTLEVRIDINDTERLVPFVDNRQVSYAYAMRHAVGEI